MPVLPSKVKTETSNIITLSSVPVKMTSVANGALIDKILLKAVKAFGPALLFCVPRIENLPTTVRR